MVVTSGVFPSQIQFGLGLRIEQMQEKMEELGSTVAQVEAMTAEFEKVEEESQVSCCVCVCVWCMCGLCLCACVCVWGGGVGGREHTHVCHSVFIVRSLKLALPVCLCLLNRNFRLSHWLLVSK